jgi:hypothetical protein
MRLKFTFTGYRQSRGVASDIKPRGEKENELGSLFMSRFMIVLTAFVVSGCAMTPEQANRRTSFELCEILVRGPDQNRDAARKTLSDRYYNCRDDIPAITAKIQAEAAASAAFFQGLIGAAAVINASQPQPVLQPYPQTIVIEQPYQPPPLIYRSPPQPQATTPNICAIGSICR